MKEAAIWEPETLLEALFTSLEELINGGSLGAELPESDGALVVVWHPDLLPAVVVEVREGKAANCALGVVKYRVLIFKLGSIASRIKGVGGVVTISGDENMSSLALLEAVGIDSVGEAWRHVGNGEGESVLEASSDGVPSPVVVHWVLGEFISPNTVKLVFLLVVVDEELSLAIAVKVDKRDVIGAKDLSIINDLALDELTIDS